jgi:hypothetical protein
MLDMVMNACGVQINEINIIETNQNIEVKESNEKVFNKKIPPQEKSKLVY